MKRIAKKDMEFKLRFHSDELKKQLEESGMNHDFKSFTDYVEEMMDKVIDEIYEMAESNGFYHADQINMKVALEYQENEG